MMLIAPLLGALVLAPPLSVSSDTQMLLPEERLPLGGYTDRRGRLMDPDGCPLYARALVLRQGSLRVAVISMETLTIPASLQAAVEKRLPSDVRVFLAATHTHSAPDSQMLNDRMIAAIPGIATYKPRWLEWYADGIARTVQVALARSPQSVSVASARFVEVPLNRGRRPGARPDRTLARLEIGPWSLVSYAAHATFYESDHNATNGDWPGEVAARQNALVLVGAIGDVSPVGRGLTAEEKVADFGRRVDVALAATPATPLGTRLRWSEQGIELGPVRPHPDFAKDNKIPDALARSLVGRFAPESATVRAFAVGKVAVVGVPGEPTAEVARQIQRSPEARRFERVLVLSHVGGWIGYILTPADYDRGGYEATLSFHGRETGSAVVLAARKALGGL